MNAILSLAKILVTFTSISSFAQADDARGAVALPLLGGLPVVAMMHNNMRDEALSFRDAQAGGSVRAAAASYFGSRNIRTDNLGLGMVRASTFALDDRSAVSIYAPTRGVNCAMSFAKAISGNRLNESLVAWVQGLSALSKRRLNAEFAYSTKIGARGELNSTLAYRLNPEGRPGGSDVIASLRYSASF